MSVADGTCMIEDSQVDAEGNTGELNGSLTDNESFSLTFKITFAGTGDELNCLVEGTK